MDWQERRKIMKELSALPVRDRGRLIRDYAAGRPVSAEGMVLLRRWAPAYPPYGWIALATSAAVGVAFVLPMFTGPRVRPLAAVVLGLWLFWSYQPVRNLRAAARLRREPVQEPAGSDESAG